MVARRWRSLFTDFRCIRTTQASRLKSSPRYPSCQAPADMDLAVLTVKPQNFSMVRVSTKALLVRGTVGPRTTASSINQKIKTRNSRRAN